MSLPVPEADSRESARFPPTAGMFRDLCWKAFARGLLGIVPACPLAMAGLRMAFGLQRMGCPGASPPPALHLEAMGLAFPGPVGLAAGFDRYGAWLAVAEKLGFGFVETGTVTPRPERGHNRGIDFLITRLNQAGWGPKETRRTGRTSRLVLGISIAKNLATPSAQAACDYLLCLRRAWNHADYIALNLGSAAWRLHRATEGDALREVLERLKEEQETLAASTGRRVPLVVKLTFDYPLVEIPQAAHWVKELRFEGLIVAPADSGAGRPVRSGEDGGRADPLPSLRALASRLRPAVSIISVGGIRCPTDARARLQAGASLVQIYRGLAYEGPSLASRINQALLPPAHQSGPKGFEVQKAIKPEGTQRNSRK